MFLARAIKEAKKGRHHQHKVGAIIMRGGSIISVGHNFATIHAEESALRRCQDPKGTTIIVVRTRKSGELGMAKPCIDCENKLREAGVKMVYYTTNDGEIKRMKL